MFVATRNGHDLPDSIQHLHPLLLAADEQMLLLGLAAWHPQEVVELQHPPLAARPSFASLVEDGLTGVVGALFVISGSSIVCDAAILPLARRIGRHGRIRIVGLVLRWSWWCRWLRCGCLLRGLWYARSGRRQRVYLLGLWCFCCWFGFWCGSVVYG